MDGSMRPLTRKDYEGAVQRLGQGLTRYGIPPVPHCRLRAAVMDRFDDTDFLFVHTLLHPPSNIWHTVQLMPKALSLGAAGEAMTSLRLCKSLEEGVAYVKSIAIRAGIILQDIVPLPNGGFEMRSKGVPLFRINPLILDHVAADKVALVNRALRTLRRHGHESLAVSRLRQLPGLQALTADTPDTDSDSDSGPALIAKLPNLVETMRTLLREDAGLKVDWIVTQELVAAMMGATDWSDLTRHSQDALCQLEPVAIVFRDQAGAPEYGHRFFPSPAAAIAGFCEELTRAKVVLFPYYVGCTDGSAVTLYASSIIPHDSVDAAAPPAAARPEYAPLANWRIKISNIPRVEVAPIEVAEVERWLPAQAEAQLRALIEHLLHGRVTPAPSAVPILTAREVEVLGLLAQGKKTKTIALALNIAVGTVQLHLDTIRGKLGVDTRVEAVTQAIAKGLIQQPPSVTGARGCIEGWPALAQGHPNAEPRIMLT